MPLAAGGADTFVSQKMSQLRECRAIPLGGDFPNAAQWLPAFTLQRIFTGYLDTGGAPFAFTQIRTALQAIEAYDEGCAFLSAFVSAPELQVSPYFRCLGRFETAIAAVGRTYEAAHRIAKVRLFNKRDGSPIERLNWLYNTMKHTTANLPPGFLQPLWLENDGVHGVQVEKDQVEPRTEVLTFDELREFLSALGKSADHLANGKALPPPP